MTRRRPSGARTRPYRARSLRALTRLAVLAPALVSPLVAQQPDSTRSDTTVVPAYELARLTAIVTRASTTTGGASAVVLSLDSAAHLPAPTLEQVLRAMPLIQIRQNSRGEAQPALRGAEDRQIAILMDGVPLTLGWDHRSDLSVIPLTAARSITMVRGLSSVLHGTNVLGGVVEVDVARGAARQARPHPLALNTSLDHLGGRALALTGGTLLERDGGQWVVRGGLGYQDRPGVALPQGVPAGQHAELLDDGGDTRLNSDAERVDGFLSARFLSEAGLWLSLAASGYRTERGVPPEAHLLEPRLWRYPYQDRLVSALSAGTGLRETPWGEGDLELSVGLDDARNEIDEYASRAYRDVTGGEDADDRTVTLRLLADHTLGGAADLRTAFTWADVSHDEVLSGEPPASYRQRLWSAASEVEWRLGVLPWAPVPGSTRLNVGFALDGADTPESGDKPPLGGLHDWGARVGATSALGGGALVLHGGVSRRTRFPALRELYSGALGRFLPNPDLRPEVMTGAELGFTARGGVGGEREIQVVGFHQRLADAITRQTVDTPEGGLLQRVNQGEVVSTGVELLAGGRLGALSLQGDLTLQRVRGRDQAGEDVELEYEPAWAGKLSAGLPLVWSLAGSADVLFRGEQACQNPEADGLQTIDRSASVDLSLSRRFRLGGDRLLSRVEAVAVVENLTDAWVFDQCGLPQPGRTLRVQLRLF